MLALLLVAAAVAAILGSGQASSASDGVVEVAGSVEGGLAVVADELDGVNSEVVEAGGEDDGVGIDSALAAWAIAAAAEAVGKPLGGGLVCALAGPADEARSFQILTAGGFATDLGFGAGGGAGASSAVVVTTAASADLVSPRAGLGCSSTIAAGVAPVAGAASAVEGSAAAGGSATGRCSAGAALADSCGLSSFLAGAAGVDASSSTIGLLVVVEDDVPAAAAASAFLGPPLADDGPVLPPSLAGPAFFSPCR